MSPSPFRPAASIGAHRARIALPAPTNRPPPDPPASCLSRREIVVVVALCEGLDRGEIARRIRRSRSTCDKAISAIYRSTGFGAAHQVVAWAYRVGLFEVARARSPEPRR